MKQFRITYEEGSSDGPAEVIAFEVVDFMAALHPVYGGDRMRDICERMATTHEQEAARG